MLMEKYARALALAACLGLMAPGMAMSATDSEGANGTKTMTKPAKNMNNVSKGKPSATKQSTQKAKAAPAKSKAPAKKAQKKRAAPQDDSVRGG